MNNEIIKNRSMTYLLPLTIYQFEDIEKKAIVNTYIYNINEPDFNIKTVDGLFLLVSYKEESPGTFKYNPRCKYIQPIDDKYFMVFIEAPSIFDKDLNLLINSKYSKISVKAKEAIINFYNLGMDTKQYKILTKNAELKEQIEEELGCELSPNQELGEKFELSRQIIKIVDGKTVVREVSEIYNVKLKSINNE